MKRLLLVVGTRPNYIKITQFKKQADRYFTDDFNIKIVHTGQHYDKVMADDFFEQLDLFPDFYLTISQGSANTQMAEMMLGLETVITNFKPNMVIVPGDVNSTLAAALTAHKMGIPVAHLESGLRSFDRSMPEEMNRILVDNITDVFFVTEQSGMANLIEEGKPKKHIYMVGNTMIDTLVAFEEAIALERVLESYNLKPGGYCLLTMHRPATVDYKEGLEKLIELVKNLSNTETLVFPIHPRTLQNIDKFGLEDDFERIPNIIVTPPLDYFKFQSLIRHSKMVITDSGGIQEETTFLQKPCLTLRPNTERPSTITVGTNTLLNFDSPSILDQVTNINLGRYKPGAIPHYWDGQATHRILQILKHLKL